MSVYKDKREWNVWNDMVAESKKMDDDFRDMPWDNAVLRADKKIQSLRSKNYCLSEQLKAKERSEKGDITCFRRANDIRVLSDTQAQTIRHYRCYATSYKHL